MCLKVATSPFFESTFFQCVLVEQSTGASPSIFLVGGCECANGHACLLVFCCCLLACLFAHSFVRLLAAFHVTNVFHVKGTFTGSVNATHSVVVIE